MSTQSQKKVRIHKVFKMLCEGSSTATVHDYMKKEWKLSVRSRTYYIKESYDLMKRMLSAEKETLIAKTLHQREFVIEKLATAGNFAMMSQAISDRDKVLGLYEKNEDDKTVTSPVIHLHKVATRAEFNQLEAQNVSS